jgi:hypothetical protein
METDKLRLFNAALVAPLVSMDDDELWNFLLASEARIKKFHDTKNYPITVVLYMYRLGWEKMEASFWKELEYYRDGLVFTLVVDLCFEGEAVALDYWARCGYLDDADSCDAQTSDDVMPPCDDDYEEGAHYKKYFHLIGPAQLENIIRSMEKNFDKLTENTRTDIAKIKKMKRVCLKNPDYKVAYIYDT